MTTIIAGSRGYQDYEGLCRAIQDSGFEVTRVLSGGAFGVDRLGLRWASEHRIPVNVYRPDYDAYSQKYRRLAPLERNTLMVRHAEGLIAIWNGESRGTADVIRKARKAGLKVYVKTVTPAEGGRR